MSRVTTNHLRAVSGWHRGPVEVRNMDGSILLSVVFSWDLGSTLQLEGELLSRGYNVRVGGPAARYAGIQSGDCPDMVRYHNPNACFTSRGCVNNCPFCIVPNIEGYLVELASWEPRPIVCDSNLLACSRRHFDRVVDSLKPLRKVDFNQGLEAAILSPYHASRLAELDMKMVRISWDNVNAESRFMFGWDNLRKAGFPSRKVGVFVLIGFHDTPRDALYRLETVKNLGGVPFPMRYQPPDSPKRNSYVGENWTNTELVRYCRYWANLRITRNILFNEFEYPW